MPTQFKIKDTVRHKDGDWDMTVVGINDTPAGVRIGDSDEGNRGSGLMVISVPGSK
jgi:hypothetical protein